MIRRILALAALGGLGSSLLVGAGSADAIEASRRTPAPILDAETATNRAVIAGGCFWGVQGVFQHVKGVTSAVSGYAGGKRSTARYDTVGSGLTGHAEAVEVTFDPAVITYGEILRIYFSVAHDPTELNQQGPDRGTQYRSAIFPVDAAQRRIAAAYVKQLGEAKTYGKPIATTIETGKTFFAAEGYHQDYLARNPDAPYIVANDLPKIGDLERLFPERFRREPVLTSGTKRAFN